jgi:spermidine synthase
MRWGDRFAWAALFFISGFSALIYEILWIRDFSFLLGNSTHTISVVLAAYMAGLALGSFLSARWAPRCRRPLRVYALLEAGIGLCGLGIHALFQSHLKDLGPIGASDPTNPASMALRFMVSFALLLPPTALMGATLPYLA